MNRRGVSLIELVVVVAIVGLLISLLLPAVQSVRLAAGRSREANKLRQFGLAINSFAATYNDRLPNIEGRSPNQNKTIHKSLFPYLEVPEFQRGLSPQQWQPPLVRSEADPSFDGS